ncbi:MAG: nicotinamide riboside transporter PnuC [Phocaeicola sp.]
MLEYIGTVVGLIYLWLEYKASIYLWIASIIMPAIYLFVYYEAGLYADVGINVYYLLAALYGWMNWRSKRSAGSSCSSNSAEAIEPGATLTELPITQMPLRYYLRLGVICTGCFFAIAYLLKNFTDSTVPWLDSFTTALSIAGMWMLAKKYIEQWWVWLVVNVVCAGLYLYKGLEPTAVLYTLYALITLLGYRKWKRLMITQAT